MIGNYQKEETDVTLPADVKKILTNNLPSVQIRNHVLHMKGYQFVVMEL